MKVARVGSMFHSDLNMKDVDGTPEVWIDNETHACDINLNGPLDEISSFWNSCEFDLKVISPHIVYEPVAPGDEVFVDADLDDFGQLSGTGSYKLEDIFGLYPESLINLKSSSNPDVNMFTPDTFVQEGSGCQGGKANPPWAWEDQFLYTAGDIIDKFLPETPFVIRHNPYFPDMPNSTDICNSSVVEIVNQDATWTGATVIEKLEVLSGKILDLDGFLLQIDPNGYIIVHENAELILNGAVLQLCEENSGTINTWKGIQLKKGAKITMKNRSVIKDSKYGIHNVEVEEVNGSGTNGVPNFLSDNSGDNVVSISNSTLQENGYGVLIHGNNNQINISDVSKVENCSRGVRVEDNTNGSLSIANTFFSNNIQSVGIWLCGEENLIDACTFDNEANMSVSFDIEAWYTSKLECTRNTHLHSSSAVYTLNTQALIHNGNRFEFCDDAVSVHGTNPLAAQSTIGDFNSAANYFFRNGESITIGGNWGVGRSAVSNNYIEHWNIPISPGDTSQHRGIAVYGDNKVDVSNNSTEYLQDGIYVKDAAENQNIVNCNDLIASNHQDLTIKGDNGDLKFLQNDVTSHISNARIALIDAKVSISQGEEGNPSDNCFNATTIPDLLTTGSTIPFRYYHFTDPCNIPTTAGSYVLDPEFEEGDNCPNMSTGSNYDPNIFAPGPVILTPTYDDLKPSMITSGVGGAVTQIVGAGGDDPTTYVDEGTNTTQGTTGNPTNPVPNPINTVNNQLIYDGEVLLDYYMSECIHYGLTTPNYSYTEQILISLTKWKWQKVLCGFYIETNQLNKARALLLSMPQNTADELAFVELQTINIYQLENGIASIPPVDVEKVRTIALGDTPTCGYAWSLYYMLTDINLPIVVPTATRITPRHSNETVRKYLYPNPTHDGVYIQNVNIESIVTVTIRDVNGLLKNRLENKSVESGFVDMSNFAAGIYFLTIELRNEGPITEKIVKI